MQLAQFKTIVVNNKNMIICENDNYYLCLNFNFKRKYKWRLDPNIAIFGHYLIGYPNNDVFLATNILTQKTAHYVLYELVGINDAIICNSGITIEKNILILKIEFNYIGTNYILIIVYNLHFVCIYRSVKIYYHNMERIDIICLNNKIYEIQEIRQDMIPISRTLQLIPGQNIFLEANNHPRINNYNDKCYYYSHHSLSDGFYLDVLSTDKTELDKLKKYSKFNNPIIIGSNLYGYTYKILQYNSCKRMHVNNNYIFFETDGGIYVYTKYIKYIKVIEGEVHYVDETNLITRKDDTYTIYELKKIKKRKSYIDMTKNTQYWNIWRLISL